MTWKARLGGASPIPIPVCRVRLQIVHGNWLQPVAVSPLLSVEILRFTSTLRTFRVSQSTDRLAVADITESGSEKTRRPFVKGRTACAARLAEQMIVGGRHQGSHLKGGGKYQHDFTLFVIMWPLELDQVRL